MSTRILDTAQSKIKTLKNKKKQLKKRLTKIEKQLSQVRSDYQPPTGEEADSILHDAMEEMGLGAEYEMGLDFGDK